MNSIAPAAAQYVKRCPRCGGERPPSEEVCEGDHQGALCGWSLSGEPVTVAGAPPATTRRAGEASQSCQNGHPMAAGDQLCLQCGETPAAASRRDDEPQTTEIEGWLVRSEERRVGNER